MKKHIFSIILLLVYVLQLVAEALTLVQILRLGMLPDTYTLLLIGALVFFALMTGALLFIRVKKRSPGVVRRVIGCILALMIMAGCFLLGKVMGDASRAIDHVTQNPVDTNVRNMYVFVRNDDPAQSLEDARAYTFAYIADYDLEHMERAILSIEESLDTSLKTQTYVQALELADALYNGEIEAAIMNGVSVSLLMEEEGYEDFTQKVRILHAMELDSLEEAKEPTAETTEPVAEQEGITNMPFIVYISGSDTRSKVLNVSRSDVNILAVVNPMTKQILLLNTPRDYYIPNPAGKDRLDKLTHCGLYGVECSMEALGKLYGLEVDYYGQINFTGFEALVDAVGGITVYSDQAFSSCGYSFQVGENTLNGSQALVFCRERYRVAGGDNGRGKNQMKAIRAVIEKLTNGKTVISNYSSILSGLSGMFKTNVSQEEISDLVKMQLKDMSRWNIQSFAVTGYGGSERTYSMPGLSAYVMHPNKKSVEHASQLVKRVMDGEILTDADMKLPE